MSEIYKQLQTTLDFACDDHWQKHYFRVKWSLTIFTRPLNLNMTTAVGTLHLVRREGGCGIGCRKQMNESLAESRQWDDTRVKSRTFISFTTIDFHMPQALLLWRFPSRWDSYIGMYFSTLWLCHDAGTLCSFLRVEETISNFILRAVWPAVEKWLTSMMKSLQIWFNWLKIKSPTANLTDV